MGHSSSSSDSDSSSFNHKHLKHQKRKERKERRKNKKEHRHDGQHHGGLISAVIGGLGGLVGGQLAGHRDQPHYPPSMSNNQPGSYPAPNYPPPGHDQSQSSFPTPNLSTESRGYPNDQPFVPYGQGQLRDTKAPEPQQFKPPTGPPPAYTPNVSSTHPPPSGHRIPLNSNSTFFPNKDVIGPPPCLDADGSPLFFGSALFGRSVHPCKVGTHLESHALVAFGGKEAAHKGRYDLLPFDPEKMELVRTSHGLIPQGRRPVEGGYEENGTKLFHAVANIHGMKAIGKTGQHLGGANVGFGGEEHVVAENYEILCWR